MYQVFYCKMVSVSFNACTYYVSDYLKCQDEDEDDEQPDTGKSRGASGRRSGGIPAVNILLFVFMTA